jgi:transcription-repair coupling factor (superfamily II helicase)
VNNARLKQVGKNFMLVVENIKSMADVHSFLHRATQAAQKPEANKA